MMNYVIIDDEPAAIEVLEFHLNKMPSMKLKASFRDPLEALDYLQNNKVDLVFLDINMPELSGIGLSKLLKNPPLIIFTTAYSEYALESYELKAVDYLLKPIQFDRLLQSVIKVKQLLSPVKVELTTLPEKEISSSEQTVFVKSGSEFHQVSIKSIKYIESDGNYVTFHTTKRAILARYKISEVLKLLPNQFFTRVHRSYIVAFKHIETVKKHCVVIDGKEIPISSNYREDFFAIITDLTNE
jgi:two-component system LytT family response regulator